MGKSCGIPRVMKRMQACCRAASGFPQHGLEIGYGFFQAFTQRHFRFPAQSLSRQRDIGTALPGVVFGEGFKAQGELEPVSSRMVSASSSMVNSPGFPILTGR